MFTGLVDDIGTVIALQRDGEGARLRVGTRLAAELQPGDSVAVNGVCLTVRESEDGGFVAEAMNETLRVTSLGPLGKGDRVNLELPLRAGDPLGGHFVQGHVDGTAEVLEAAEEGFARRLRLGLPPQLGELVVERGSIALDGVSLTVSAQGDDWVEVSLIPETLQRTNLADAAPGRRLNVECDLVGKYVQRLLAPLRANGKG